MSSSEPSRRRDERIPLTPAPTLESAEAGRSGRVTNISRGGVFVETQDLAGITLGMGLKLEFRLPVGYRMSVFGRVAWLKAIAGEGRGYGVEFCGLDGPNLEILHSFLDSTKGGQLAAEAVVFARHSVEGVGKNQLRINLNASLTPEESQNLEMEIGRRVKEIGGEQLLIYIHAAQQNACSKASLECFRRWFGQLGRRKELAGVLVGPESIFIVQLRRIIREAGVASAFVSFPNEQSALEFWTAMTAEMA